MTEATYLRLRLDGLCTEWTCATQHTYRGVFWIRLALACKSGKDGSNHCQYPSEDDYVLPVVHQADVVNAPPTKTCSDRSVHVKPDEKHDRSDNQ